MRLAILTLTLLTSLFGCGPERHTWNQRMTLVVETPDGIVTGSSIVEVNATYCPDGCGLAGDIEVSYGYRGEAVALEVLPGQWLFALIGNPAEVMYRASPDQFGGIPRHERGQWLAATPDQTEPVELTGGWRPRLVTFGDIADPVTVAAVDPDNLAATFGEGVQLTEVTLEVVREGAEFSIPATLSWLETIWPNRLDGQRFGSLDSDFPFANSLSANSFSTEIGR